MSIIIRLQGLPLSASSLDIRRFFHGLTIPDGGVHIIGGEEGIAFIAFSTDEDARQAMARENENTIKDSKVKLYLSSRNEMKQVIDKARNQNLNGLKQLKPSNTQSSSSQGNGASTSIKTLNNILNSNLSQHPTKTVNQQSQINYTNNGTIAHSNTSSLVGNLQEAPDYRRNRSPVDRTERNLAKSHQENHLEIHQANAYGNQHVKHVLDQVRTLDVGNNSTATTVRSRLGGFNLPSNEYEQTAQTKNRWNDNSSVMNGLSFAPNSAGKLLTSPHAQTNPVGRVMGGPFFDHQQSHQYSNNDLPLNHPQQLNNPFIVELRGLPINVQTVDFQTFFRPVGVLIDRDQIKLSLDAQKMFHGIAHIFFNNEQDLEKALLLNGRSIRDFQIEVLPVVQNSPLLNTPSITYPNLIPNNNLDLIAQLNFNNDLLTNRSGDSFSRRKTFYPVFMKGIPYDACTPPEVAKFFEPIPVFEVIVIQERSGRPTGNAYIIFDSKETFELGMMRNTKYMGKRYIELFAIQMDEIEKYRSRMAYRQQLDPRSGDDFNPPNFSRKRRRSPGREFEANEEPVYCVQIRGLPPGVDNLDITDYLKSFGITASVVHIMLRPDGSNAGECFVEFKTKESQEKALTQSGSRMGNSILNIKTVSHHKVRSAVRPQHQNKMSKREMLGDRRSTVVANLSPRASVNDVCALFQDYNLQPNQVEPKLDRNGQGTNEVLLHFRNPKEADRVIRNMNHKYFIDSPIYLKHA